MNKTILPPFFNRINDKLKRADNKTVWEEKLISGDILQTEYTLLQKKAKNIADAMNEINEFYGNGVADVTMNKAKSGSHNIDVSPRLESALTEFVSVWRTATIKASSAMNEMLKQRGLAIAFQAKIQRIIAGE